MSLPVDNAGSSKNVNRDSLDIVRRIQEQIDSDESLELHRSRHDDDVQDCVRLIQQQTSVLFFPLDTDHGLPGAAEGDLGFIKPVDDPSGRQEGQILDLEFIRILGTGGFGVVLAVRNRRGGQCFAMKILRPSLPATSKLRRKFLKEAELTADFRHPGIVRVYGTGLLSNHPFILTELIEGESVADLLRSSRSPLKTPVAVSLILKVCQALRYAHEHDILHRDLKPENILLAKQNSDSPESDNSVPVLTDFGLAKRIEPATGDSSLSSQIVGTILYMAPEVATGQRQSAGVPADLFALAAILYRCVTGRVPFEGTGYFEIISKMVQSPIPSARKLNPRVSADLDMVLQKALSKNPGQRYQTAAEFETELERLLSNKPVLARQSFYFRRFKRFLDDHPRLSIAGGVLLVVIPIALVVISVLYWRERRAVQQNREMLVVTMNSVKEYTNIAEHVLANVPASNQERYDLHWSALKAQEAVAKGLGYNAESRYRLSVQYSYLATAAIRTSQPDLSRQHRKQCLELLRGLAEEDPNNLDYLYDIFYNQKCAADEMPAQPRSEKIAAKEQALIEIRRLREKAPMDPDFEDAEAACLQSLAYEYVGQKNALAEAYLLEAIRHSDSLFKAHPSKLLYSKYAIISRAELSDLYRGTGRLNEAAEIAEKALSISKSISHPEANDVWFVLIRRESLRAQAASLSALNNWAEAAAAWQVCLTTEDFLHAHDPGEPVHILGRCSMYVEYLRARRKLGLDHAIEQEMMAEAERRLEAFRATKHWPEDLPDLEAAIKDEDAQLQRRVR